MKDLDFDELDRAVNSLIAKTPGGSGSDEITTSVVPVGNNLPTEPVTAPLPVVERPSTGRFMDVVHPSSNMRASLVMPERTSIQTVKTPVSMPSMVPVTPRVPVQAIQPMPPTAVMPLNNLEDKYEDADIDQISNDIANTLKQASNNEPLDSPFLSGAKVEKRPLGAFSNELISNLANQSPVPVSTPVPMFQSSPATVPLEKLNDSFSTPLPAELQDELLSIESDDSTTQPDKLATVNMPISNNQFASVDSAITSPAPVVAIPPITASVPITTTIPVSSPAPIPATTTTATMPVNTSIPQQYKEQQSSGDQNNGAIYDTKAYHKAMVNPSKKKSGWMWVMWIAIFLVAGAGIGAAVYFLVLPHL